MSRHDDDEEEEEEEETESTRRVLVDILHTQTHSRLPDSCHKG